MVWLCFIVLRVGINEDSKLSFGIHPGGTGSGLGSFLTEEIKEVFGPVTLANFVIWPRMTGEVAVQSYNSMLSLSHLQGYLTYLICTCLTQ